MPDEVQAFAGRIEGQRDRDELDDMVERARAGGPQKRFQLGKGEFDRMEIRTAGWEESDAGADVFDRR